MKRELANHILNLVQLVDTIWFSIDTELDSEDELTAESYKHILGDLQEIRSEVDKAINITKQKTK